MDAHQRRKQKREDKRNYEFRLQEAEELRRQVAEAERLNHPFELRLQEIEAETRRKVIDTFLSGSAPSQSVPRQHGGNGGTVERLPLVRSDASTFRKLMAQQSFLLTLVRLVVAVVLRLLAVVGLFLFRLELKVQRLQNRIDFPDVSRETNQTTSSMNTTTSTSTTGSIDEQN